ncbi:RICIN domain-containing protein [Cryptosporangium sp. NPDC051539]|uniref:RICIN domain-containing protein n=1 Tax=Cryptosporangium sp. NPDC051539 TaxID=3363962 RepID=UPI0037996356
MGKKLTAVLLTLGAIAAGLVATPGGASAAPSYHWEIWNWNSGRCLQPASYSHGARVTQGYCDTTTWTFAPNSTGWYHLIDEHTGWCMSVSGGSMAESAPITEWTCGTSAAYDWLPVNKVTSGGIDYYQLRNRNSSKCLNVPGSQTGNGVGLIQYTCQAGARNNLFSWATI